jgi:autotransporter-associated beta strand protein
VGCGSISFSDNSTAGNATLTAEGGAGGSTDLCGAAISFSGNSTAGNATITNESSGYHGGTTWFGDNSTADNATLIANGGFSGGSILFGGQSTGATARVEVFGNGKLDISSHVAPTVTVGSIEGNGAVFLGARNLTVGANDLGTSFSGVMHDAGSFTKIGTGTLILSGANVYTGGTRISAGTLLISNASGSGTGSGWVIVDRGATLGGNGTITLAAGTRVINNGTIAPGDSTGQLNVNGNLQLDSSSNLSFQIGGAAAGYYDVLNKINGDALTLHGMLTIRLINGFLPRQSDTFTIVRTQAALAGGFANVNSGGRLNTADGLVRSRSPTAASITSFSPASDRPLPDTARPTSPPALRLARGITCSLAASLFKEAWGRG